MNRRDDRGARRVGELLIRPAQSLPTLLADPERRAEDRLGRRSAKTDEYVRLDSLLLCDEPRSAGDDLAAAGLLVQPALPAFRRDELEVLDRVGHVHALAVDPGLLEHPVEHPAGRTDERPAERSSWSSGCSPTSITRAFASPSPKTVCVATSKRPQPSHAAAAPRSSPSAPPEGTNRAAPSGSAPAITALPRPRDQRKVTAQRPTVLGASWRCIARARSLPAPSTAGSSSARRVLGRQRSH